MSWGHIFPDWRLVCRGSPGVSTFSQLESVDQSLGVRWEHTALTGDCGVQGEPECEHIFPTGVCGGESRSVSLKRTALTGVLCCGEAGGPEAPDEPLPVTPRLPPTLRSGDPRVAGGTVRRLTCG